MWSNRSRSLLVESLEVRGIHEVGHRDSIYLEEQLFHWIGGFVVIQTVRLWTRGVKVGGGINQHLGQFVRGGEAHLVLLFERGLDKDFGHRQPFRGQVVIALHACFVGSFKECHRPRALKEAGGLHQLRRRSPDRSKVLVHEFLHGRDQSVEIHPQRSFRAVKTRDCGHLVAVRMRRRELSRHVVLPGQLSCVFLACSIQVEGRWFSWQSDCVRLWFTLSWSTFPHRAEPEKAPLVAGLEAKQENIFTSL